MDIEKFLDKKTTTYTFVKADELYDFLYEKENLLDNTIGENRDYIFALKENNIVGYAILFDTENKLYDALKNTYTLSNIAVAKDFRNKGIATGMIDLMLDEVKKSNRILIRTKPDLLGKLYTYNKITKNAKDKNVYFIPHNLSFIYKTIEKSGLFTNKKNEYKMNLFDTICDDMLNHPRLKEWDINELKDLDDGFYDVLHDAIDSKKLKLSKKKPKI